ncbi:MAG: O-antigen ligase family protein [Acidimicrobiia bacterium]
MSAAITSTGRWPTERTTAPSLLGHRAASDTLVLVFFGLFYANVLVVASQFYGVPAAVASSAVVVLLVPFLRRVVVHGAPMVFTPTLYAVLLYLAAMLLSAATSNATRATLPLIANFALEGLGLYLLVSNAAYDRHRCRRILGVIVLAAVLMSVLAIFQEATRSYDQDFGGFAQVSAGGFEVREESSFVAELRPRLAGPIGEQNRFAQILLVAAPFAYFGARAARRPLQRRAAQAAAATILCGVLVTFSRGAAVALAGLMTLLVVHRFARLRHLVAIALAFVLAIAVVAPDYSQRLLSLTAVTTVNDPTSREADGAIRGRAGELLGAWNTFTARPITGVGPGRYFRDHSQIEANKLPYRRLDTNRRAHNLYAEILADLGLIGFGAFAAANVATIVGLIHARRRWCGVDPERENLAAALLFGLYAYLLTGMFLQLSYQRYYWVLLALANAGVWSLRTSTDGSADPSDRRSTAPRDAASLHGRLLNG